MKNRLRPPVQGSSELHAGYCTVLQDIIELPVHIEYKSNKSWSTCLTSQQSGGNERLTDWSVR